MILINSVSQDYFELDGIRFARIYQPLAQGSQAIGIYSIYDTKQRILNSTRFDEFLIDGANYSTQAETIAALLNVIWAGSDEYNIEQLEGRVLNLEENQYSGVVVYSTYAELPATGTLLVSYKVSNDPDSNKNGYYHWDGAAYIKDANINQPLYDNLDYVNRRNELEITFGVDSLCYLNEGNGVSISESVYIKGSHLYIRGDVELDRTWNDLKSGTGTDGSLTFATSTEGVVDCIKITHQRCLVFDTSNNLLKDVSRNNIQPEHMVLFRSLYGRIEDGDLIGWKLNRYSGVMSSILNNVGNVSLIRTPNFTPKLNVQTQVLDLGADPVLLIGKKNYTLKSIWPSNPEKYREIDLSLATSSAIKLYYDTNTNEFIVIKYNDTPLDSQVLIGGFRRDNGTLRSNLPFDIEKGEYTGVSLIIDIGGELPVVNSGLKKLDLGPDPILLIGEKTFTFQLLWPSNPEKYREISLDSTPSSAGKLYFDILSYEFRTIPYNSLPRETEVLIGGIRNVGGVLVCNFPFEIASSGSGVGNVENVLLKPSQYYIAHRGVTMGYAPENTLDAYKLAGRMGFAIAECDVSVTSDGEYVLMHDSTINRTCKNAADYTDIVDDVFVNAITLATLRSDYVLASSVVRFRQPVPTLEEFLLTCREYGVKPMVEIKSTGMTTTDVANIVAICTELLGEDGYVLTSFSNSLLDHVRTITDEVRLYYISETNPATLKAKINAAGYFNYSSITDSQVKNFKDEGVEIGGWTIPNNQFNNMLKLGLNFVATDTIASETRGTPVLADYSDGIYESYNTDGEIVDGIIELDAGETVTLIGATPSSKLGAFYLNIEFEGELTIAATNLTETVNHASYESYTAQCMLYNEGFALTLTAVNAVKIKDIVAQVTKY